MKIARDKDFIGIRIFNFSITFDWAYRHIHKKLNRKSICDYYSWLTADGATSRNIYTPWFSITLNTNLPKER